MVLLNFSSFNETITVPFPKAGAWTEKIDGVMTVNVTAAGDAQTIAVPSWYGYVFLC